MTQYRKKPIVIDAFQFDGSYESVACVIAVTSAARWFGEGHSGRPPCVEIQTLEGTMTAMPGDWIIRGVKGEFYPCKPDIFAATYEPVAAPAAAPAPAQADLLRCPFCGGGPEMLNGDGRWSQVGCKSCAASGPEFPDNDQKAIQGWNRRTSAPAQAEGWQQIATVPTDGRRYLLWFTLSNYIGPGKSDAELFYGPGGEEPTHWMPLPVPPSAPDAEPE